MASHSQKAPIESFTSFGELLHFLRRRARLTQLELGIAVGYSEAQISRLEQNKRLPDLTAVAALFMPALDLADEPGLAARLMELAAHSRSDGLANVTVSMTRSVESFTEELGSLEAIPELPAYHLMREGILSRLRKRLESERCLALCGLPGSGKTILAAQLAREYTARGAVFWLTLTDGMMVSPEVLLHQLALFLLTCGQESVLPLLPLSGHIASPMPFDRQINLVMTALEQLAVGGAPLICLDNLESAGRDEVLFGLFRRLAAGRARLILISSEALTIPGVTTITLRGLEPEEGRSLVACLAGDQALGDWSERLLEKTANPMLLRLAVGQLAENQGDPAGFIASLEVQPHVADYLMRTVQKRLSSVGWCLVSLLSTLRYPINLQDELLVELCQEMPDPCPWTGAINELRSFYLIETPDRASLHPLIRDYVYAALSADPARRRAFHRVLAKWYELCPGDLVEAAYHYARAGDLEHVVGVLDGQADALFSAGKIGAAADILDESMRQLARKRVENLALKRRLLVARGDLRKAAFRAGEAESDYRQALALAGALDPQPGQANVMDVPAVRADIALRMSLILMQRGQTLEALGLVQSAAAVLQPGDVVLLARLASIECRALNVLSRFDEAEKVARLALDWAARFADYLPNVADDVRARAFRTLGWVAYTRHPESPEALQHYRYALAAARRAGLRVMENGCLSNIATALVDQGNLLEALNTYQQVYDSSQAMGDIYTATGLLHNMASVNYLCGDAELALRQFEQAREAERQLDDWNGLLSTDNARGDMLMSLGRVDEARQVLEQALITNPELTSDTWTLGSCLCSLAEAYVLSKDPGRAEKTIARLLAMDGIRDNARIYTGAQLALALANLVRGDLQAAGALLLTPQPEDLGWELGLKRELVEGVVLHLTGSSERARAVLNEAIEQATKMGYRVYVGAAQRLLAALDEPLTPLAMIQRLYYPQH